MHLIIYDTEFTAWEGSQHRNWGLEWEARELIQFSASCVQITEHSLTLTSRFDHFVQPQKNPQLSPYIQQLTGITQPDVDQGLLPKTFFQALSEFSHHGQIPMTSWGNDWHVLHETATLNQLSADWIQSYNLIELFQAFGINTTVTSGELFRQFDLPLHLEEHNAFDDTRSLVESLIALHKQTPKAVFQRLQKMITSANPSY